MSDFDYMNSDSNHYSNNSQSNESNSNTQYYWDEEPPQPKQQNTQNNNGDTNFDYNDQNNYNQYAYTEPKYATPKPAQKKPEMARVISMGEWIWTYILFCIPFVNIVMMIVWACDKSVNPNKRNLSKAMLIITGIIIALYAIVIIVCVICSISLIHENYIDDMPMMSAMRASIIRTLTIIR